MTSQSHLTNEVGTLVAMNARNPMHTNSLRFPGNQYASDHMSPAFQPDAFAAPLSPSNDIGALTLAPATDANGWATKQDWARHQTLIKQLYRDEKKPLAKVMRFMESQHGFKATSVIHAVLIVSQHR